jgi:putative effector of murein hydrolase LrgA (UPF0299 family)
MAFDQKQILRWGKKGLALQVATLALTMVLGFVFTPLGLNAGASLTAMNFAQIGLAMLLSLAIVVVADGWLVEYLNKQPMLQ